MSVRRDKRTGHWYYDFKIQRRRFSGSCTAEGAPVTSKRAAERSETAAPLTIDLAAGRFWSERGQLYANSDDT